MRIHNNITHQQYSPVPLGETVPTEWNYSDPSIIEKYKTHELCFYMLRCVRDTPSNELWVESYKCIRKFYPNKIIIIDDNSSPEHLCSNLELKNCEIIKSEFGPGKAELLPYYYFHRDKPFQRAVFLQDATFIRSYIDFVNIKEPVKFLWTFYISEGDTTNPLTKHLKGADYLEKWYWDITNWRGCFGLMTVSTWDFVDALVQRTDLFNLLPHINCRADRVKLEKLFGCICTLVRPELYKEGAVMNNIVTQYNKKQTWEKYKAGYYSDAIVKVWCGR